MTLLFIYNANSGALNTLFDVGHKLFSPSTYKCSLCALTFDTFKENALWKSFRTESSITMVFYHKDEFEASFPKENISYHSILKFENDSLSVFFDPTTLNNITTVDELIIQLKARL